MFAETLLEVMTDFQKFIKEQNERSVERKKEFDPQKRIEQFRECVADLYYLVDTEWLNEELANGSVTTGTTPITVTEERLGAYQIDAKWIQIGEHRLLLRPVGTIIIGTKARVDLIYKSIDRMFVLVGENIEGARDMISIHVEGEPAPKRKEPGKAVWKIVNPQGRYDYLKANKSNFEKVIMEVINETW